MGRTPRRVPPLAVAQTADLIAADLRRRAEGPHDAPATWVAVAVGMGLRVVPYHAPGGGRGEYLHLADAEGCTGVVAYNTAYPEREQAGALVHELAHHLLAVWQPPLLEDAADYHRYDDDPRRVQHRVARKAERKMEKGGNL